MKVEFLVTIKLGDGRVMGKGTIMSEPFPIDVRKEIDTPRKTPILRVIEEAKPVLMKPVVSSVVEVKPETQTTFTPTLIPDKTPKGKKPKIKKAKLG